MLENSMYLWLLVGWVFYFFIHSFLASDRIKGVFNKQLKISCQSQRLIYNLIATLGLLGLLFLNGWIKSPYLLEANRMLKGTSLALSGVGIVIIKSSFKNYSLKSFLGVVEETDELRTDGILSSVRHPIYSGTILITVGFFLFDPRVATLVSGLSILMYLIIGIRLEEKKLEKKFGDRYRSYKQNVPMLFPKLTLLGK